MRSKDEIGQIKAHLDYITDMIYIEDNRELIAVSGDTSITVNDMRQLKTSYISHDGFGSDILSRILNLGFNEEGTSLQPINGGSTIVCGTSTGKIALFSSDTINKTHAWFSSNSCFRFLVEKLFKADQDFIVDRLIPWSHSMTKPF